MTAVQLMCARLGLVTGLGLAGVIRRRYSRWVLWGACALVVIANVINIAADLGGMAEATMMVIGAPVTLMVPVFGAVIIVLLMWSSYRTIARVFKWLTLVLLAYILTAFVARVDWRLALEATVIPHMEWSRGFFSVLVAILGTTISPYLFFWQAAQEVEEERAMGRDLAHRRGATPKELNACWTDVVAGMFASNAIMYFIIMTTAATLHAHDQTNIATAQEAAEALRPLAGAGRVLAVYARPDRHRYVGGARPRGLVCVRDRRSGGLARIAGSPAAPSEEIIYSPDGGDGSRDRVELCGPQRDQAALHDGGDQRDSLLLPSF